MHPNQEKEWYMRGTTFVIGLIFGLFDSYMAWPLLIGLAHGLSTAWNIAEENPNNAYLTITGLTGAVLASVGWYIGY